VFGYDVAYAQYERQLSAKGGISSSDTRGPRSGTYSAGLKAAAVARKQRGDRGTAFALNEIATTLQIVPTNDTSTASTENSDDILVEAFSALRVPMATARAEGVRAATLANFLSVGLAAGQGT